MEDSHRGGTSLSDGKPTQLRLYIDSEVHKGKLAGVQQKNEQNNFEKSV
jgi:hypothetical protein